MKRPPNDSFRIAPAEPTDYGSFARLFPELATGDPTPDMQRWLTEIQPTTCVVRAENAIVGYAHYRLLNETGYVRNVVVAPEHRGKGLGRLLMGDLAQRLLDAGARTWCLNVKPDNVAAVQLYRSMGMSCAYASTALRLSWDAVSGLPPAAGVGAKEIQPSDDAALESVFDLPPGQIADARRSNRVLLWLEEGSRPAGIALFNPSLPGAFPFRILRVELARDLFEAVRRHARPEFSYIQAVIENDPGLADALLRAGAEVRLQMEHYRGQLLPDRPR